MTLESYHHKTIMSIVLLARKGANDLEREMYRTQVRVPQATYEKARVLASVYGCSFNQLLVDLLEIRISQWEEKNGVLPTLAQEDQ